MSHSNGTKEYRIHKLVSQDDVECYIALGEDKNGLWKPLRITESDILSGRATAFSSKEELEKYMMLVWDRTGRYSPYSYLPHTISNTYIESVYL